jgi:cell division FtsZ-interacting protein ZapD
VNVAHLFESIVEDDSTKRQVEIRRKLRDLEYELKKTKNSQMLKPWSNTPRVDEREIKSKISKLEIELRDLMRKRK